MNILKKQAELVSFKRLDEIRNFPKGKLELEKIGGTAFGYTNTNAKEIC